MEAGNGGTKSVFLRGSKTSSSKGSNLVHKPASREPSMRYSSSKVDVTAFSGEAGHKLAKLKESQKLEDACSKEKRSTSIQGQAGQLVMTRSGEVKSPTISRNPSAKRNVDEQKKVGCKSTSAKPDRNTSVSSRVIPKVRTSNDPALVQAKSLSRSLNADPQKILPPIKTVRSVSKNKNTRNLCVECRAEVQSAVCFIGNNGRVSACSSGVKVCKNLNCSNNNSEQFVRLDVATVSRKKSSIDRRHSQTLLNDGNDKMDGQTQSQNGSASDSGDSASRFTLEEGTNGFLLKEDTESDARSSEDIDEAMVIDGIASASPHGGRLNGYCRMRSHSLRLLETEATLETVTLKKQMMERKQAEEWMPNYMIEEAFNRLVPSKESKVKALVEAFESVIVPNKDSRPIAEKESESEKPKSPGKTAIEA
ncbi:hypothetical protein KP509_20G091700 [Ceratopteris richardii]|nr:hypothetical protein KP509_20G091700 [Ceratopteris richardii]